MENKTNGSPVDKALVPTNTSPLAEVIRAEIVKLCDQEGFDVSRLHVIEGIARNGKALLQAVQGHAPSGLRGTYSLQSYVDTPTGQVVPASGGGSFNLTPSNGQANETFGTRALRELQAMLGKLGNKNRSRSTILRELAVAREEGLEDIAAELKQELDDLRAIDKRIAGREPGIMTAIDDFARDQEQAAAAPPTEAHVCTIDEAAQ